ncbi:uncharacterized protein LOC127104084 [Lathyrus oleraceus]|uniref:Uncharacterized protein n=1 Tax=Pisum sativum TaxID=3888 RepID=A0A9D4VGZ4_PEA|nr:uncharacterized protein LOC127104084 [Pisum sativum]KAI5383460.1 hypothetical protein KIW84_070736 [Pisum sativum]
MGSTRSEYCIFMNYDRVYDRLQNNRTEIGAIELDLYLSRKHDEVLARALEAGSYIKITSLAIVDAFIVEITEEQANVLRSANGVRVVVKNEVV